MRKEVEKEALLQGKGTLTNVYLLYANRIPFLSIPSFF